MKLTLRNATIRTLQVTPKEAGLVVRVHVAGDYGKPFANEMEWPEALPANVTKLDLGGELIGTVFTITPTDKMLAKREIAGEIHELRNFTAHRVKDGEAERSELRFILVGNSPDLAAAVAQYIHQCGAAPAALTINAKHAPEQQELPMTSGTESEGQ